MVVRGKTGHVPTANPTEAAEHNEYHRPVSVRFCTVTTRIPLIARSHINLAQTDSSRECVGQDGRCVLRILLRAFGVKLRRSQDAPQRPRSGFGFGSRAELLDFNHRWHFIGLC